MIPLAKAMWDNTCVALVGEHEQLSPSAASTRAADFGAGILLLERLWQDFGADPRICTLLDEQF